MGKGRIKDIYYEEGISFFEITQKVKKQQQWRYENDSRYKGGFGTFSKAVGSMPSSIIFKVKAYDLDKDIFINLKEKILEHNNMKRISPQLIEFLKKNNKGRKVTLLEETEGTTIKLEDIDISYK